MINDVSIDIDLEKSLKSAFGFYDGVNKIVLRDVDVAPLTTATIFFDRNGKLYVFIESKTRKALSDIRKILSGMGLKAKAYLPPKSNSSYFDDLAIKKFLDVYPGRRNINADDLRFYRTLVPYNPALVQISQVKNGIIKVADSDSRSGWRNAAKLNYSN